MSFVITVSTSSIVYTPPSGSENAFAGQTIASATWNATFTDLSNNGLAVVGKAGASTIKGNNTNAVGVVGDLTPAQAGGLVGVGMYAFAARGVNFSASTVPSDTTITINVPTSRYMVDRVAITNASASLLTSIVGLYTAINQGGVTVALSQSVLVSSSLADIANGSMILVLNSASLFAFNDATLQFHIVSGVTATADVILYVRPM